MMREAAVLSSSRVDPGRRRMPACQPSMAPSRPRLVLLLRAGRAWRPRLETGHSVAELGDAAFALDDHPNDPVERFVFIEGYAHIGRLGPGQSSSPRTRTGSRATTWARCCAGCGSASRRDGRRRRTTGGSLRKSRACSPAAGSNVLASSGRIALQCDRLNKDVRMTCIDMCERRRRADTYDV